MTEIDKQKVKRISITSLAIGCFFLVIGPLIDNHFTVNVFLGAFFIGFVSMYVILSLEGFVTGPLLKKLSAPALIFLNSVLYLSVITVVIFAAVFLFGLSFDETFNPLTVFARADFLIGLAASFAIILVVQLFSVINVLLGKHVLLNVITAKYHKPHETEKIVMFLDVKSSTSIAERIGHLQFLSLLNDFFHDISESVVATKGEIYKYVGDEAIIVWDMKSGVKNANCARLFFMISDCIRKNANAYRKKYGAVPEFKAGMHCGPVVVGEMGSIKKEITYLGDVLNTTSRIESYCAEAGEAFIVSKAVVDALPPGTAFRFESLGTPKLKGKENALELFAVRITQSPA